MKNIFRWLEIGFKIYNRDGSLVQDLKDIKPYVDKESLTAMFASGYYFFNKTHQVKVSTMDDYNTYFGKVQ